MTTAPTKKAREMPKGGRKGGSIFPRVALAEALVYAKKLVSKTHTGPQTRDVVLMGVIGSKYGKGELGMSALKQYGLMTGDAKSYYSASDLAKKIAASPPEELVPLYRRAALKPTVFSTLFETYHGDTVSKAKLKQRAADLKVHPDETGNCVDLYIASMVTAKLAAVAGDQVTHIASAEAAAPVATLAEEDGDPSETASVPADEDPAPGRGADGTILGPPTDKTDLSTANARVVRDIDGATAPRAVFNVNVTLDASLDVEKLERQLALLRKYGAL
jgi:hypothetical protein